MGKQYSEEEKRQIQDLAEQGHTDESIAQQLGRSTNAIRNIRHRTNIKTKQNKNIQQLNRSTNAIRNYRHRSNIKTKETNSIQLLKQEKQKLTRQTQEIEKQIRQLETRRDQIKQATQMEEENFKTKLEAELVQLKNTKPELFEITGQEQLTKLTVQLGISLIRWVFE